MNVKQLKTILQDLPDNMDVFVAERTTDFEYGLVENVYVDEVDFMEEPAGKVLATDTVLIISEL